MASLKHFKVKKDQFVPSLPDPIGSVSKNVDRGAIEAANEEATAVLKTGKGLNTKGYYINIIPLGTQTEGKCITYLKTVPTQKKIVA